MKLKKQDIFEILNERFSSQEFKTLSDMPHPYRLLNLEKASKRVAKAIKDGEKIALIGDYDVDGVVSSSIIKEFFDLIEYPLEVYIPNRFSDGYGVSEKIINKLDCSLAITVDNGISAFRAGEVAKELGIDLVITDHHEPSKELPEAYTIVNPKLKECPFEFKDICGALVAWYLVAGLKIELKADIDLKRFFDILSIAIIADVMPLIELNRVLVKSGLNYINQSNRPSIVAIREYLNISEFKSETIAFQVSPRLNSAGRIKDASLSFNFLLSESIDEALYLFDSLNNLNEQRKELEADITNQAIKMVDESSNISVVYSENWHEGVIGIVASRLVDRFKKPAIVFSITDGIAKGSARSYSEIDILKQIDNQKELLLGYGGHKKAGGLSLKEENLEKFREKIDSEFESGDESDEDFDIMGSIDMSEIDFELLTILDKFEPYGESNPKPKFLATDLQIKKIQELGKNQEHLKFTLFDAQSQTEHTALAFRATHKPSKKEPLSFKYTINKNEFNNRVSIQLIIDSFK